MSMELSQYWTEQDKPIYFVHNFTDQRHVVDVLVDGNKTFQNNSIPEPYNEQTAQLGQYVAYNDSTGRPDGMKTLQWVVNGKGATGYNFRNIQIKTSRCDGPCLKAIDDTALISDEVILWSTALNWPGGKLPAEGDDIEILPEWNMVYDIEESPILG